MNNSLDYQSYYSNKHPGLWILLTDEEEESINQINRFINNCIQENFNGKEPVDRCYLHVLGINGIVHRLISGYLSDLEKNTLEIIKATRQINEDLNLGISQIQYNEPIWCRKCEIRREKKFVEALKSIGVFIKEWIIGNPNSPAPVIWYVCSEKIDNIKVGSEVQKAVNEIKEIECKDGNVLFVNVFSSEKEALLLNQNNTIVQFSSFIPESYVYNFRYMAKYDLGIDYRMYGNLTHMSFNLFFMDRLVTAMMGWLSEPRPDMDLMD